MLKIFLVTSYFFSLLLKKSES